MIRILLLILIAAPWTQSASRAPLPARIRSALNSSPLARSAFWGIEVADMSSGRVLFQMNSDHFFVPASNTKLFTTALGLTRLGTDYRARTTVFNDRGDLVLFGGGDANLSGRVIPYEMGSVPGNALAAIEDLAGQIFARGIRRVEGNVVGDDSAFLFEPYAEGWSIHDAATADGAPVSALVVNDNTIHLQILPADVEGAPAKIQWDPPLAVFDVENRVITDSRVEKKVHVDRLPGSRLLRIWGALPRLDDGTSFTLAVEDPARFAALALLDALQRRGVVVNGNAVARHLYPGAFPPAQDRPPPIAERLSPPLLEDLRIIGKVSQNLHAEILLRTVARERTGSGSRVAGLAELQQFLDEAGIDRDQYSFHDGSGLSRLNIVTPRAIVSLLRYMGASQTDNTRRDNWMSLFPISGVDGTMSARLSSRKSRGHVRAKTGSLSHTSALSGYAERSDGRSLVFCIVANNFNGSASEIRGVIDRIGSLLLE